MGSVRKNDTFGNGSTVTSSQSALIWCYYTSLPYEAVVAYKINVLLAGVTNCVFGVAAILLNSLVLTAFIRNRVLLKGSNMILFGLCIADLISGMLVQLPLSAVLFIIFTNGKNNMDCVLLTLSSISGYIFVGISLLTVSFVSLERFISIFYPYIYTRTFTKNTMIAGSVSIWVFMLAFNLYCFLSLARMTFFIVQSALISFTYIWTIIVYFKILKQVRKITKEEADLSRRLHKKEAEHELKANRIVRFVILSLLACYSLQVIVALLSSLEGSIRVIQNYILFWAFTFGLVNCSLNPLVYCYCNSEIRKKVQELIGLLKRNAECPSETVRPSPNPNAMKNL